MDLAISLIIVSYNTKELTLQSIETLLTSLNDLKSEIIVVDNHSHDGSVEAIRNKFPSIKVIPSPTNLGFGKANNLGASHAKGKYLGFFNSDIIATPTTVKPLITYLTQHLDCGIVAPKIYMADGKTVQSASFGPEPSLMSLIKRSQQKQDALPIPTTPVAVDWVTGAAFCIRRDLFETIQGFDELIFMYYEDVDLCRRVRDEGFTVMWIPEATLIHLGGKSIQVKSTRKKTYYQAQLYYTKKHYGVFQMALLWLLRLPFVLKVTLFNR